MVLLSIINPSLEYEQTTRVDKKDYEYESSSYDIIIPDICNNEITITFGRLNNDFAVEYGVSYYSMYLVVDGQVRTKIGILEIPAGSEKNYLDDDGDIDIENMPKPLTFTNADTLVNSFKSSMLDTDESSSSKKIRDESDENDDEKGDGDDKKDNEEDDEKDDGDDKKDNDEDDKDKDDDKKDDEEDENDDKKDDDDDKDDDEKGDDNDKDDDEGESSKSLFESVFQVLIPKSNNDDNEKTDDNKTNVEVIENKASTFFEIDENKSIPAILDEENKADAEKTRSEFKSSKSDDWIKVFMKNDNYNIQENDGSGDCIFIILRDAYAEIGKNTTVPKLRELLANEVDDEIFQTYRTVYLDMENELFETSKIVDINKKALLQLKKSNNDSSLSRNDRETIINQAKKHTEQIKSLKKRNMDTENIMKYTHGFMKELDTIEKFQDYIKTSSYWADDWAISTLEHKLNVKLIVFSESSYDENAYDSVLNCGKVHKESREATSLNPNYYIIACYNVNNLFKGVSYKNKKILTYREIPYDIKMLVINKCLEHNSGPFYKIQEFRNLKSKMGISPDEGAPEDEKDNENIVIRFYLQIV